jgi:hypothetical protein
MFHRWAALVLVLALCAMSPKNAAGQTQSSAPRGHGAGKLGKPYPNPFNPEVTIPFSVVDADGNCTDGRQLHVVNMRILNILGQLVVVPGLSLSSNVTTGVIDPLGGTPLSNLKLGCGSYEAYWKGLIPGTQKEAASGMYLVQLLVDGVLQANTRIFLRK